MWTLFQPLFLLNNNLLIIVIGKHNQYLLWAAREKSVIAWPHLFAAISALPLKKGTTLQYRYFFLQFVNLWLWCLSWCSTDNDFDPFAHWAHDADHNMTYNICHDAYTLYSITKYMSRCSYGYDFGGPITKCWSKCSFASFPSRCSFDFDVGQTAQITRMLVKMLKWLKCWSRCAYDNDVAWYQCLFDVDVSKCSYDYTDGQDVHMIVISVKTLK